MEKFNMIERSKITRFTALIIACVLLVGAMVGFGISATTEAEMTSTAEIVTKNVEHKDYLHLAFNVAVYSAPEGAQIGIMVWSANTENYTSANKIWESYELKDDGAGTTYYASQPIAAKDIATVYRVAVVAKTADGITLLSVPAEYSVQAWAEECLAEIDPTDLARINLYNKVIAYGKAASGLFNK